MIDQNNIGALLRDPTRPVTGNINGLIYTAKIAIPNYAARIGSHYGHTGPQALAEMCRRAQMPLELDHFGLILAFDRPAELGLYDGDRVLDEGVRRAIARFGLVAFRNAYIESEEERKRCQRNIFPNLRFHFDRGANQHAVYSLYTRDGFDPVQKEPRTSSTVFIANIVAYLQSIREKIPGAENERGVRGRYDIFPDEDMEKLIGEVVLEQAWDAPLGTGEIAVIDNRTVLHASYYRNGETPGYPIGTRYVV